MDELLGNLKSFAERAKKAINDEIVRTTNSRPHFEKTSEIKKPVMIRQLLAETEEEAKAYNLSTDEGIKNTEEFFRRMQFLVNA